MLKRRLILIIIFAGLMPRLYAQESTVENLIGRLLLLSFTGSQPPIELLQTFQPAGFIFFPSNIPSSETARNTTQTLQANASYPLLFAIDQEGGPFTTYRVDDATMFPGNMALGATGDETLARAVGEATAEELAYLGINLNFAPSVDVNVNPENPVIGIRSFGADPNAVARLAKAYHEGLLSGGVASTAKHFPGHGDTNVDSHLALPVIAKSMKELEDLELVPFKMLILAGVPVVMTSHIIFPELDSNPATLSQVLINDVLRTQLGFQGVVITDYMDMAAIASHYGPGEAAVQSVLAGNDLVEVGSDPKVQQIVYDALLTAYREGRLSDQRIREAVARSSSLAATYPAQWSDAPPDYAAHRDLALQVATRSATLIKNDILPLTTQQQILVVASQPDAFGLPPHLGSFVKRHSSLVQSVVISESPTKDEIQAVLGKVGENDIIVLAAYQWLGEGNGLHELARVLLATGKPLVVVTTGNPNALSDLEPSLAAFVAVYGYREASLEAAAQLLFGELPQGKLPVAFGTHAISWGLLEF